MRIFTNEVATANALEGADSRVRAFAWEDPLAFGRLVSGNDLDAFASARSIAYASANWDEDNVAEADLQLRNAELREAFDSGEEVFLLFGSSLRDQLQLSQILGWLSERPVRDQANARLMQIDGPLSVFERGALFEVARAGEPIAAAVHAIYAITWDAVSGTDPFAVEAARDRAVLAELTALEAALERWLQELPSVDNGLSITQMQTLDAVRLGVDSPQSLYEAVEETEAAPFRTNWEFWQTLALLCSAEGPLLNVVGGEDFLCPPRVLAWEAFHGQRLELSERGQSVLEGRSNFLSGSFAERWLGGAKIDAESRWFWDYASRRIVSSS